VQRQPELLHVVFTLRTAGILDGMLDRRQADGQRQGHDGQHNEQFDNRQPASDHGSIPV
jgi:hypothetical protein